MENPVKYILKPSLEDMALVQIALTMWNHENVRDTIVQFLKTGIIGIPDEFYNIRETIIQKVKQLKQPKIFQEKIKRAIIFIGSEIEEWIYFHWSVSLLNESNTFLPADFCLSPYGTVDKKKTSEIIVNDKNLDVFLRYKWACIYCLWDVIWKLWNEMCEDCQKSILIAYFANDELYREEDNREESDEEDDYGEESDEEQNYGEDYDNEEVTGQESDEEEGFREEYDEEESSQGEGSLYEAFPDDDYANEIERLQAEVLSKCNDESKYLQNMVCLWTLAIKNERLDYTLSFPYLLDIFESSVKVKNKAATEYFLQGLKERSSVERVLVSAAKFIFRTDHDPVFLCFLLSKMTEEQILEVIKDNNSWKVLRYFLHWPFQTTFMETADRMWDFISQENYRMVLAEIFNKSTELFGEFWQKSPTVLKSYIINDEIILIGLIHKEDKKNSTLILQDAAAIEKKVLANCDSVRNVCKHFLSVHELSSLKFFIRRCLFENSVISEMLKFKEEFENHIMSTNLKENFATHKEEWDEIFEDVKNGSPKRIKRV